MPAQKGKQDCADAAIRERMLIAMTAAETAMKSFDESTEFDALYESMWKCRRGKLWKASVARFMLNGIEETMKLEEEIKAGTYKPRKPHSFTLYYPKVRPCSSTHIRDRIVQRSLNDNVIYPAMTRSFIWDNMACQTGKGTTKAMDRINCLLHRYYINNGNSSDGFVLQADIRGYYRNMRHREAETCFRRHLDEKTVENATQWLQRQYPYEIGYEPGSQMVQILGISMLDRMDHMIKEKARAKYYLRYMDDFFVLSGDRQFLEYCRDMISEILAEIGLELHQKKTRIYPIREGIRMLGFTFKLTDTGKVVRIINPENVKHERKKLYRMAQLVKRGELSREKFDECYTAWKAHANLGNTYQVQQRMNAYVKELFREEKQNERHHKSDRCPDQKAGT